MADSPDQLATVADLATWLGVEFDDADTARAEFILRVASGWARDVSGKLWPDRVAADFPQTVFGIVLASSRREFENPRRVTYDVKGPESTSYSQAAYPPGFFTDGEITYLRKFRRTGGLWTQATYRDNFDQTLAYLRITDVNKPMPYGNSLQIPPEGAYFL